QPAASGARSPDRAPTEGVGQPAASGARSPDAVVARSPDRATPAEQQITLHTRGRLTDVEQFENIILKTGPGGRVTRVKDVARVELGPKNQDVSIRFDGKDTVFLAIFQMPDANALDLHQRILDKMEELKQGFPEGVTYDVAFDTTPYTSESIREVVLTLR